jgi:hypothetical protein
MDYKGHNHVVRRLQLEMLGYWVRIANHPGWMLEDLSCCSILLGKDIHIDPLLKDYISFTCQAYFDGPPSNDPLNNHNMPGYIPKRTKTEVADEEMTRR